MLRILPPQPSLEHLKNEAKALLDSLRSGDRSVCPVFRRLHRFADTTDERMLLADVALTEAQFALAMDYGFASWQQLREAVLRNRPMQVSGPTAEGKAIMLPAPPAGRAKCNRFTSAMHMLMAYCGADCDYHTVAGDSGLAFILQADDRHTPYGAKTSQIDIGWWPLDHFGALLRLKDLGHTHGVPLRTLPVRDDESADQEAYYREHMHEEVVRSLNAGRPVVAVHADHCLVTGLDEGQPPLLGQLVCSDQPEVKRLANYPWAVIVPGEPTQPVDRSSADRQALSFAVDLHNDRCSGLAAGKSTGKRSYELWARLARDENTCGPHYYHGNVRQFLRINRQSAPPYLRAVAQRHSGSAAAGMDAAADAFEQVLVAVSQANCSQTVMSIAAGRAAFADAITELAHLDQRAFAQLEAALSAM